MRTEESNGSSKAAVAPEVAARRAAWRAAYYATQKRKANDLIRAGKRPRKNAASKEIAAPKVRTAITDALVYLDHALGALDRKGDREGVELYVKLAIRILKGKE